VKGAKAHKIPTEFAVVKFKEPPVFENKRFEIKAVEMCKDGLSSKNF